MSEEKKPVFNFKEPATPLSAKQLIDQTLCTTPVPQAASTANRDSNKSPTPLPIPIIKVQPAEDTYMSGALKNIEAIKEQVYTQVLNKNPEEKTRANADKVRESVESEANSSLGILKQEDLKGVDALNLIHFCESEMNKDLSERFAKELGRPSLGFNNATYSKDSKKEIFDKWIESSVVTDISMKGKDSFLPAKTFVRDKRNSGFEDVVSGYRNSSSEEQVQNGVRDTTSSLQLRKRETEHPSRSVEHTKFRSNELNYLTESNCEQSKPLSHLNPFKGFDQISICSEEFVSGDAMASKLLDDENAWIQEMSVMPAQKMSLSGVLESEKSTSDQGKDKMSLSSFMRQGSYPLGNLGDGVPQERPTFGRLIVSPEKKHPAFPMRHLVEGKQLAFELDEIPTKDTDILSHKSTSTLLQHSDNENVRDEDVLSASTVSSVASVSQIAEILSNMSSDATPRTIVNNIMSKAKSRKHLTPVSEGNQMSERKYTQDFQRSFSELCNNFKKKSAITIEEQENICPKSPKSSRVPEGNHKRVVRPLQLKEEFSTSGSNGNHTVNNSSVCESDKSTRYSSSSNSSLDLSDLRITAGDLNKDLWMKMFKDRLGGPESGSSTLKSNNTDIVDQITEDEDNFPLEDELYVCVTAAVRMDFDLFNKTENAQMCVISNRVYVNDRLSTGAAVVCLEKDHVTLGPHSNITVGVTVTPLVAEPIFIKVDVQREDTKTKKVFLDTVTGKLIGQYPDVKLLSDPIISFDAIHEGCTTHQFVVLYNPSQCEVPVTLKILKKSKKNSVFSFDGQEVVDILLLPGQEVAQKIDCIGIAVPTLTEIKASVVVSLTVDVVLTKFPELLTIPISSVIAPCRLHIDQHDLILQAGVKNEVAIQNCSPITMRMSVIPPAGVRVQPDTLQLDPGQKSSLSVGFESKNVKGNLREESNIKIQILPNGKTYELTLKARQGSYLPTRPSSSAAETPQSSRAPSPMSPSSSIGSADGNMQLECTHTTLVWSSHPVHSKTAKNCTLRNRSMHREKLLISICGSNNCFKLLKGQKKLVDQLQLSLQAMESTSLTVVMLPTHAGAFTSSLCITRINSSAEKKVLPLYGYGGKAKLIPKDVSRSPEQRMWIYLDNDTLTSSFVLKNIGDAPAFVKISQGMEATGISISPPECLIHPGTSVRVEITLTTTADRLEYLLSQPSDSAVNVTKLTLTLGDESTRHRLNRLHRKLRSTEQGIDALWNSRLMVLNGLFTDKDMEEVHVLRDPVSSLETLWHEGIREWTIGVLVERSFLESMRLDSSVEFLDLENTIMENTVYSPPPLLYKITPSTLTFTSTDCNQELTLQNMTASTVPFECQSPDQRLCVVPNKGSLPTFALQKVNVNWLEPVVPTSEYKISVIFGDKESIDVPIVWKGHTNPRLVINPGVYSDDYNIVFPATTVGGKSMCRVHLFNSDQVTALVRLEEITGPFTLGIPEFILKGLWYMNLRLVFRPISSGEHEGTLTLDVNNGTKLIYKLHGKGSVTNIDC